MARKISASHVFITAAGSYEDVAVVEIGDSVHRLSTSELETLISAATQCWKRIHEPVTIYA